MTDALEGCHRGVRLDAARRFADTLRTPTQCTTPFEAGPQGLALVHLVILPDSLAGIVALFRFRLRSAAGRMTAYPQGQLDQLNLDWIEVVEMTAKFVEHSIEIGRRRGWQPKGAG